MPEEWANSAAMPFVQAALHERRCHQTLASLDPIFFEAGTDAQFEQGALLAAHDVELHRSCRKDAMNE